MDWNDKLPQQDLDAERSVLGAVLLDPKSVSKISKYLTPDSFYAPAHQMIFSAMKTLSLNSKPIDGITLQDQLDTNGTLEDCGGLVYIADLTSSVPRSANVEHYADIVEQRFRARRLSEALHATLRSLEGDTLIDDAIGTLRLNLVALSASQHKDLEQLSGLVDKTAENLAKIRERGYDGLMTGIGDLDKVLYGLLPTEMCVIAARPSVGKSAIAANIAVRIAKGGRKVLFYSLEMTAEAIIGRMLAIDSQFSTFQFKTGYGGDGKYDELDTAADSLKKLDIYIHDGANLPWDEVYASAWLHAEQKGTPDLIIIDYIQLMTIKGFREGRQLEVSAISRGIKSLARDLKVPIIALSQISRAGVDEPQLSHLRDSGSIEQDADYVILVSRKETTDEGNVILKMDVAKNRDGMTGICEALFQPKTQRVTGFNRVPKGQQPEPEIEGDEQGSLI